jgi:hypothetical protein
MQTFIKENKQYQRKKFQRGCTRMDITGRRICCVVRELNPAPCDPYMNDTAVSVAIAWRKLVFNVYAYPCLYGREYLFSHWNKVSEQLQKGGTTCQSVQQLVANEFTLFKDTQSRLIIIQSFNKGGQLVPGIELSTLQCA